MFPARSSFPADCTAKTQRAQRIASQGLGKSGIVTTLCNRTRSDRSFQGFLYICSLRALRLCGEKWALYFGCFAVQTCLERVSLAYCKRGAERYWDARLYSHAVTNSRRSTCTLARAWSSAILMRLAVVASSTSLYQRQQSCADFFCDVLRSAAYESSLACFPIQALDLVAQNGALNPGLGVVDCDFEWISFDLAGDRTKQSKPNLPVVRRRG